MNSTLSALPFGRPKPGDLAAFMPPERLTPPVEQQPRTSRKLQQRTWEPTFVPTAPPSLDYGWPAVRLVPGQVLRLEPTLTSVEDASEATPWSFSVEPSLPEGLALDEATGVLHGTPLVSEMAKTFEIRLRATGVDGVARTLRCPLLLSVKQADRAAWRAVPRAEPASPRQVVPATMARGRLPMHVQGVCFEAVRDGDVATLKRLMDEGTVQASHLDSRFIVDLDGYTLLKRAQATAHFDVLSLFYKYMPAGSECEEQPVLSGQPLDDPGDDRPDAAIALVYPHLPHNLPKGKACRYTPRITKSGDATCTVTPPLPAGMHLQAHTGILHGTPTEESGYTTYTVTATFHTTRSDYKSPEKMSCNIGLAVQTPLSGIAYPTVERVIDVSPREEVARESETVARLPPLPSPRGRVGPQLARTPRWRASTEFFIKPKVDDGRPERFEVDPPLPEGLTFNQDTGEITGCVATTPLAGHRSAHVVLAENGVSMASCRLIVEAVVGTNGLTMQRVAPLRSGDKDVATRLPSLASAAATEKPGQVPETAPGISPMPSASDTNSQYTASVVDVQPSPRQLELQPLSRDPSSGRSSGAAADWGRIPEKVAAILDRFGCPTPMGVAIAALVPSRPSLAKGMAISSLVQCLGLAETMQTQDLLVRSIERAQEAQADGTISKVARLEVVKAAAPTEETAVYLHAGPMKRSAPDGHDCVAPLLTTPRDHPAKWDKSQAFSARGAPQEAAPPDDSSLTELMAVNEQFSALLPAWRHKNGAVAREEERRRHNMWRNRHPGLLEPGADVGLRAKRAAFLKPDVDLI